MNPRTTKDKALNLAPLAKLGYPCVRAAQYWGHLLTFPSAGLHGAVMSVVEGDQRDVPYRPSMDLVPEQVNDGVASA